MTDQPSHFPKWGFYPNIKPDFRYVYTELDDELRPKISGEDLSALSDFPAIYIYISKKLEDGYRRFYIGQTIAVAKRIKDHQKKLKTTNTSHEKFKEFKDGHYIVFYGKKIAQNLNFIEKLLILTFIQEFRFLNFVDMSDDNSTSEDNGTATNSNRGRNYVSEVLANKDKGNESGKYQELREKLERVVVNPILAFLKEQGILDKKYTVDKVKSSLFAESPFFELTQNQSKIQQKILDHQGAGISLIEGGPGTGKTVLLLHLIAAIKAEKPQAKMAIFVRNIHRKRFEKILKSYGLPPRQHQIAIVTFNQLVSSNEVYDYLIIDEAQRTTRLTPNLQYPTGAKNDTDLLKGLNKIEEKTFLTNEEFKDLPYPSFLHYIKEKYEQSHLILAYDESQRLRETDTLDVGPIFGSRDSHRLEAQLRILSQTNQKFAEQYVDFMKRLLSGQENPESLLTTFKELTTKNQNYHYIKIAESIDEWKEYVEEKWQRFPDKKSVLLAGFCKPAKDGVFSAEDDLKWVRDGEKFRSYQEKCKEVGAVYDIHGFDIDFAAVYIGKDIWLDDDGIKVDRTAFYDRAAKKGGHDIDAFVRNAYYILLTRAVYGQMLYIEDDRLRDFFKTMFSS